MRPVSGAKAAARVAARRRDRGSAIAEASTPSMRFTKKMQTGSFSPAGRGDAEPSGKTRCGIEAIDVIRCRRFVIQFHRICCAAEIMPQVVVFKGYIERAMGVFYLRAWPLAGPPADRFRLFTGIDSRFSDAQAYLPAAGPPRCD
ncbi:hypothetical protein [Lysobacter capsici]|uniref:hypothetical protein n=1 Tax=Lysobacter capsici TaxID=435897 RepID=UPI001C005C76|nr:hypothetical protein [Lysobacter capsici]QWF14885.1 hypothetical protein KME82_13780 [Lysobacter capsici]